MKKMLIMIHPAFLHLARLVLLLACVFPTYSLAELRVLTLNAEWLWTPFDGKVDGNIKTTKDMSIPAYKEELTFYAKLIQSRKIDIVAINEIENEQVARELSNKLGKNWRYYFRQGLDTATGQDVALLSRLPYVEGSLTDFNFPAAKLNVSDKPKKITKLVGAQFWYENKGQREKIGVITAHFLSKRNENQQKAENRHKQALALRQAINHYFRDTDRLFVLGDFNDFIDSVTLKTLLQAPLYSYQECRNFRNKDAEMMLKKWRRNIDHILFSGVNCVLQEQIDLKRYSDHDAIFGEFSLSR